MTPRIVPAGDATLIVEFEERIDLEVNARAVALARRLTLLSVPGVRDIVPTYRSVAVSFDPTATDADGLRRVLERESAQTEMAPRVDAVTIEVPVCYDREFGPDLDVVADRAGVGAADVARMHASREYRVFMLGFMPGFAYMGIVDERLATPRLATPRVRVAAGSVGIAGEQTGIYPSDTPGGWNIIGRTPLRTWRPEAERPALFNAGDMVRFRAIDRSAFDRLLDTRGAAS